VARLNTSPPPTYPPPPPTLQIKAIIVCGHYNCGAVKGALQLPGDTCGLVNCWISDIRECRNQHADELRAAKTPQEQVDLCALGLGPRAAEGACMRHHVPCVARLDGALAH
jgi:hypothetical protein